MSTRIYLEQLPDETAIRVTDKKIRHYLTTVLRIRKNEQVRVFGKGNEYMTVVHSINPADIELRVTEKIETVTESPLPTHFIQAVLRGQRMDYSIQKATELGATTISAVYSQHCQVHYTATQSRKKQQHWQAIARHASEQCGRKRIPEIAAAQPLADCLTQVNEEVRLVLDETCAQRFDFAAHPTPRSVALLVGPEGGLDEQELQLAQKHDFTPLQLGPRVLRGETLAPVILSLVQWHWGDMQETGKHGKV